MKKPIEEDYRYPTTGNASAIDYAEYSNDLELYIKHIEEKHNNDIHSVSDCDIDKLIDKLDQTSQEIEPYCVGLPNYKDDDYELKILRQVVRNWLSCR